MCCMVLVPNCPPSTGLSLIATPGSPIGPPQLARADVSTPSAATGPPTLTTPPSLALLRLWARADMGPWPRGR